MRYIRCFNLQTSVFFLLAITIDRSALARLEIFKNEAVLNNFARGIACTFLVLMSVTTMCTKHDDGRPCDCAASSSVLIPPCFGVTLPNDWVLQLEKYFLPSVPNCATLVAEVGFRMFSLESHFSVHLLLVYYAAGEQPPQTFVEIMLNIPCLDSPRRALCSNKNYRLYSETI